jgi:hypothetical protein
MVGRESPDEPKSWASIGLPPSAATIQVPPVNRTVLATRQDDIDFAFVSIEMSIPGPNQAPPYNLPTRTVQEQPDQPLSWTKIGVPPSAVTVTVPAVNRQVRTQQEYPEAVPSWARFGVPPILPQGAVVSGFMVGQEQPYHPLPQIFQQFIVQAVVTPVPPSISHVFASQEVPFHPSSSTLGAPGVFGNPFIPPVFQVVYNTVLLSIPGGMFSIPGDPPS